MSEVEIEKHGIRGIGDSFKLDMDLSENSQKRLVYIPYDLEKFFLEKADAEGRKINYIIKEALVQYAERVISGSDDLKINADEMNSMIYRGIDRYMSDNESQLRVIIRQEIRQSTQDDLK